MADDEEGGRKGILSKMMRHRQPAQEAKEDVAPEQKDLHDSAVSSPKASRRRTVIDFFKHKGHHNNDEESENILTRTHRTKSVSCQLIHFQAHC